MPSEEDKKSQLYHGTCVHRHHNLVNMHVYMKINEECTHQQTCVDRKSGLVSLKQQQLTLEDINPVPVLHGTVKLHCHRHRIDGGPTVVPGIIALY